MFESFDWNSEMKTKVKLVSNCMEILSRHLVGLSIVYFVTRVSQVGGQMKRAKAL